MFVNSPAPSWFTTGASFNEQRPPTVDFQMHSSWSDGRDSVEAMIEAARGSGLRAIALTEHVNAQSRWYPEFVAAVKAARTRQAEVEVYFGIEVALADQDGRLKAEPADLETELVLGVVHRYPKFDGTFWNFSELNAEDAVALELRALAALATNPLIDVLAHPGGTAYRKFGAFPVEWLEPAFIAARDHGIAVEINSKYAWDLTGLLALLRRVNPLVSFGSDAHGREEVGSNLAFLRQHCARTGASAL